MLRNMVTIVVWASEFGSSIFGESRFGEKTVHSEEFKKDPIKVSFSKDAAVSFNKDGLVISFDIDKRKTSFAKKITRSFDYE